MNTIVIAKRELLAFLVSPLAYMVWVVFLFISGLVFFFTIALDGVATLAEVFEAMSFITLFVAPILTMHLLSEEARTGTLEILLTAPVREWEVVLGKFLAAFLFFVTMLLPTLLYLFLLTQFGQPDIPVTLAGYTGLVLLGAMLLSMGLLASSLSDNQFVAAMLGIALCLLFWLTRAIGSIVEGAIGIFFVYFSLQEHFTDFVSGLITTNNTVYFLSATAGALFIATHVLKIRRWHS